MSKKCSTAAPAKAASDIMEEIYSTQALAVLLHEVINERENTDSAYQPLRRQVSIIVSKLDAIANDVDVLEARLNADRLSQEVVHG